MDRGPALYPGSRPNRPTAGTQEATVSESTYETYLRGREFFDLGEDRKRLETPPAVKF